MSRLGCAAIVAALASVIGAGQGDAQDRPVPNFDLGIYGGGTWSSDWFETTTDFGIGAAPIFGLTSTFWTTPSFGVRSHGAYLPGVGTIVGPDGRERHILPSARESVTGPSIGIAGAFKMAESSPAMTADRIFFSYNYFEAVDSRSARVAPGMQPVAFTLDRPFVFPDGGTTTGLFGGPRGMDVRQKVEIDRHRFDIGVAIPIPTAFGALNLYPGATVERLQQEFASELALITMPDIRMSERRTIDHTRYGPLIRGEVQFPIPLGQNAAGPFPILFLSVGGHVAPLFGDARATSRQRLECPICGPGFPVAVDTRFSSGDTAIETGLFGRVAVDVTPRFKFSVFGGVDRVDQVPRLNVPANPDQQPLTVTDTSVIGKYLFAGATLNF